MFLGLLWSALVFVALFVIGGLAARQPIATDARTPASEMVADYETWPATTYYQVTSGLLTDLEASYGPLAPPARARGCLTPSGCLSVSQESGTPASSPLTSESDSGKGPNCPPPSQGRRCREP